MESFSWTCPFCHRTTTIVELNYDSDIHFYSNRNMKDPFIGLKTEIITCPNTACGEYTIEASLYHAQRSPGQFPQNQIVGDSLKNWRLKPSTSAIPQPDYISLAIRQDYEEACAIVDLSPKASATLARRCLQGMIRDFWGITKSRLVDEINALEEKVDASTWEAIDAIRQLGNIGAHMEKDVNIIIDIEPHEAKLLISLIEDLFQTWYVTRYDREERSKKMKALAQEKKGVEIQIPAKVN